MSGIGIEFMVGATLLSFIRMVIVLFIAWLGYRVGNKIYKFIISEEDEKELNIKWEIVGIASIFLFAVFFGSAAQPRLTIENTPDRELIEYQRNTDEIVIETPPPRTETLDGFSPMNE